MLQSRRDFLKKSAVLLAGSALMGSAPRDFCVVDEHRLLAACQDAGLTLLQDGVIADTLRFPGAVRVMRLP